MVSLMLLGNEKEFLPMSMVLKFLLDHYRPLSKAEDISYITRDMDTFRSFSDQIRGSIVLNADKVWFAWPGPVFI